MSTSLVPDALPAGTPTIPDVVPARPALEARPAAAAIKAVLPAQPSRPAGPTRRPSVWQRAPLSWLVALIGWCWRIPIGALFCLNYVSSILVVGWTYRWMQAHALRGWWRKSRLREEMSYEDFCASLGGDAPVLRPRWFAQERIAATMKRPGPDGKDPSPLRLALRAMKVPWFSFWTNLKVGLQALLCTYLLTGWGCLVMLFSWEFGWLNSFNKGYEQAYIGPLTGFAGIFLFIAAMFYVPMAQAHQAVTGDYRAFFDFRFVWRLIQARLTPYVVLAVLTVLAALPLNILKVAPIFFDGHNDFWTNSSDEELRAKLWFYFLACSLILFPTLLVLRLAAAHIYRSAVLKVLRRGWVSGIDLHPKLEAWLSRLDLMPVAPPPMHPVERVVRSSSGTLYRWACYAVLFWLWFGFIAMASYVGGFLKYHPFQGFMNHMLVQFPCFDFMPATAQHPDFLTPMLAFAVFCALAMWGLHSAFGDWSAHSRRTSPPDVPTSKATG